MLRAYKYRLWTDPEQDIALGNMLETHRRLYNTCLEERKKQYEETGIGLSFREQRSRYIASWRGNAYYSRLCTNSAYTTIQRLDLAFKAFFRRLKAGEKPGYPRFKGRDFFDTIVYGTYPHGRG